MVGSLVSVILPVHNGERFLSAAIESVLAQDYLPLEIIAIDDGSIDGSAAIIESFPQIRHEYQDNQGAAAARNAGVVLAKGDFLAFIDADDIWPTERLSQQVGYLLGHPDVDYTLGQIQNFIQEGMAHPQWLPKAALEADREVFGLGSLVVRSAAFRRIGPFNPEYRLAEDTEWFIRAQESGLKRILLPEIVLYRRIHDRNISADWQESRQLLFKSLKASIDRKRTAGRRPETAENP